MTAEITNSERDKAVAELAEWLYWNLEKLDPSGNPEWAELDPMDRDLYLAVVEKLFERDELIRACLGERVERR